MDSPSGSGLPTSPIGFSLKLFKKRKKNKGSRPMASAVCACLSFAALQDRQALLAPYRFQDDPPCFPLSAPLAAVAPLTRWEDTPMVCCICFGPRHVGRTAAPFFKSWPWLVPRCALCADTPGTRLPGRHWCASHARPYVRFPRSV